MKKKGGFTYRALMNWGFEFSRRECSASDNIYLIQLLKVCPEVQSANRVLKVNFLDIFIKR